MYFIGNLAVMFINAGFLCDKYYPVVSAVWKSWTQVLTTDPLGRGWVSAMKNY